MNVPISMGPNAWYTVVGTPEMAGGVKLREKAAFDSAHVGEVPKATLPRPFEALTHMPRAHPLQGVEVRIDYVEAPA